MSVAVLIGSWVLVATIIIGFGTIFLAMIARSMKAKKRKKIKT